jgi:hypothetical protein
MNTASNLPDQDATNQGCLYAEQLTTHYVVITCLSPRRLLSGITARASSQETPSVHRNVKLL